jgi:hypothetical protein
MERFLPIQISDRDEVQTSNDRLTDSDTRTLNQMGEQVLSFDSPVTEPKSADNRILVLDGAHGGGTLEEPNTQVQGMPGSVFDSALTIENHAVFDSCTFSSTDSAQAALVTLAGSAKVVFRGCTFQRTYTHPTSVSFVVIPSTAKAVFVNCVFAGSGNSGTYGAMSASGGTVISSAAAAGNVQVAFCVDHTGWTTATAGQHTATGNI